MGERRRLQEHACCLQARRRSLHGGAEGTSHEVVADGAHDSGGGRRGYPRSHPAYGEDRGETPKAPEPEQQVLLKHSTYTNQASEGTFALKSPGELLKYRENYEKIYGAKINLKERPTDEQLCALLSVLASGRAPFLDFAVFGPFDEHEAKLRKYTDQVFIDGRLQTRLLHGPTSFEGWRKCWAVFRSAMVMLDAASLGALNSYEEGLKELAFMYESSWAVISQADLHMRSVQWAIVLEEAKSDGPMGYDASKPWDYVIRASSFSTSGIRSHWWWLHVVGPLSKSSSARDAVVTANRLEGRPNEHGEPAPKKRRGLRSGKGSFGSGGARAPPHPQATQSKRAHEVCYSWNSGQCTEPCPDGRAHKCRHCSGSHRMVDCPRKPQQKGHDNNKKKKSKKGGKGGGKASTK